MEYKIRIFPEHRLVIEEISGQVTLEDLIEKMKNLFDDRNYKSSYCGVVDLRKGNSRMSKIELLGFANLVNESDQFGHAPWAILCTDPMVVALSQIFKLRVKDPEAIGVFDSVDAAAKFVGKPELNDLLHD
jgi:hypothetical protein